MKSFAARVIWVLVGWDDTGEWTAHKNGGNLRASSVLEWNSVVRSQYDGWVPSESNSNENRKVLLSSFNSFEQSRASSNASSNNSYHRSSR